MMTSPAIQRKTLPGPSQPPAATESAIKDGEARISANEVRHATGFGSGVRAAAVAGSRVPGRSASARCLGDRSATCARRTHAPRVLARYAQPSLLPFNAGTHAGQDSSFRWTNLRLGPGADCNRSGELHDASDSNRPLEVAYAGEYTRGTLSRRVLLRKRAAPRAGQPHCSCRCTKRPGRNRKRLPLLLRCLRAPCQPVYAGLHGRDRSVSQTRSVPVALA